MGKSWIPGRAVFPASPNTANMPKITYTANASRPYTGLAMSILTQDNTAVTSPDVNVGWVSPLDVDIIKVYSRNNPGYANTYDYSLYQNGVSIANLTTVPGSDVQPLAVEKIVASVSQGDTLYYYSTNCLAEFRESGIVLDTGRGNNPVIPAIRHFSNNGAGQDPFIDTFSEVIRPLGTEYKIDDIWVRKANSNFGPSFAIALQANNVNVFSANLTTTFEIVHFSNLDVTVPKDSYLSWQVGAINKVGIYAGMKSTTPKMDYFCGSSFINVSTTSNILYNDISAASNWWNNANTNNFEVAKSAIPFRSRLSGMRGHVITNTLTSGGKLTFHWMSAKGLSNSQIELASGITGIVRDTTNYDIFQEDEFVAWQMNSQGNATNFRVTLGFDYQEHEPEFNVPAGDYIYATVNSNPSPSGNSLYLQQSSFVYKNANLEHQTTLYPLITNQPVSGPPGAHNGYGKIRAPGTLKNIAFHGQDAPQTNASIVVELNGANTPLLLEIGDDAVVGFNDLDPVDLASNDIVRILVDATTPVSYTATIESDSQLADWFGSMGNVVANTLGTPVNLQYPMTFSNADNQTVDRVKTYIPLNMTLQNFRAYVPRNDMEGNTVIQLYNGNSPGASELTIANGVTGWFEDEVNRDIIKRDGYIWANVVSDDATGSMDIQFNYTYETKAIKGRARMTGRIIG